MSATSPAVHWSLQHSYVDTFPEGSVATAPAPVANPRLVYFNAELAAKLGLDTAQLNEEQQAQLWAGNWLPESANPVAQVYAGHQFGNFSPQLGDGRALILGEAKNPQGELVDIAFKGSGRTPFSRGGDGKAALGPMLREVIMGETMAALGIPTTRALAVVSTGETVARDRGLPGALLTRVAASHLRVGTFEFFAARQQTEQVKKLADYSIQRHFPQLAADDNPYLALLGAVTQRQAELIARWMLVGFIHGVMNTDNMVLSGETIDYGPCAFMENYDPDTVFSSIDDYGRYAYGNQPRIARWNLARFAECLLPLIADDQQQGIELATDVVNGFTDLYQQQWLTGARQKLGLQPNTQVSDEDDLQLAKDWFKLLQQQKVDMTLGCHGLIAAMATDTTVLSMLIPEQASLNAWLIRWQERLGLESNDNKAQRLTAMTLANPRIIPRNHLVEQALSAASDHNDFEPFEQLLSAVRQPFSDSDALASFAQPATTDFTDRYRTFCGT